MIEFREMYVYEFHKTLSMCGMTHISSMIGRMQYVYNRAKMLWFEDSPDCQHATEQVSVVLPKSMVTVEKICVV